MFRLSHSDRREIVATAILVVFSLSQCCLPMTGLLLLGAPKRAYAQQEAPAASLSVKVASSQKEEKSDEVAHSTISHGSGARPKRLSLKALDLTRDLSEAELKAAGGFGGELSPIGNADTLVYESELDTRLKKEGMPTGLKEEAPPQSASARLLANAKSQLARAKKSNRLFAQAVQERSRRNFPRTAQLFRSYLKDFPDGPWVGEAHLHLAMEARAHHQESQARWHYKEIFQITGSKPEDAGYDVRQKAKQGWTNLDLSQGRWAESIENLRDILRTETDWRRWTWAAAWLRAATTNQSASEVRVADCGNLALAVVLAQMGHGKAATQVRRLKPSRPTGFSLAELANLSRQHGLPVRGFRTTAISLASLPTPLIIHKDNEPSRQGQAAWSHLRTAPVARARTFSGWSRPNSLAKVTTGSGAASSVPVAHCSKCLPPVALPQTAALPQAASSKITRAKHSASNAPLRATTPSEGGHFLVVQSVDRTAQTVSLYDPQLNQRYRLTYGQLEREWSGNGLVAEQPLAAIAAKPSPRENTGANSHKGVGPTSILRGLNQRKAKLQAVTWLSQAQMARILGGCCCIPTSPGDLGGQDGCKGAPGWSINRVNLNQFVSDTPIWYETAKGPDVEITQNFNSQDALNQNAVFGNKWSFNYGSYLVENPDGGVTVFMPDGRQDLYTPLATGSLLPTYTPPAGIFNTLKKSGPNNFILTFPGGEQYLYAIPTSTNSLQPFLVAIRDRWGAALTLGYSSDVLVTTITDAQGKVTRLIYDANGHIVRVNDPFGRFATFRYDANGNLIGSTDMGGYNFSYAYDDQVRMTRLTKPEGSWTFKHEGPDGYAYDGFYPPAGGKMNRKMRLTVSDPLGQHEEYFYTGYSSGYWYVAKNHYVPNTATANVETAGVPRTRWTVSNTAKGRVTSVTEADGTTSGFQYDDKGLLIGGTDARGFSSTLAYNVRGQVTEVTDRRGQKTKINYAPNGLDVTSIVNALGQTVATATYNAQHQPLTMSDALGRVTTLTYTPWGALATVKPPSSGTTTYNYDSLQRLLSVGRGGSTLATFTYDPIGRVVTSTDVTGLKLTYSYDNLDRVTSVAYPDTTSVGYSYSSCCGVVDSVKDRSGRLTQYDYDPLKRLTFVQDPAGLTTQMAYDKNGNLTLLLDSKGKRTRFTYDSRDRVSRKTYADNSYESYSYDGSNHLIARRSPNGITTSYSYDANDNLTRVGYAASSPVLFAYDALNRRTRMTDATGTTLYSYDTLNRVVSENGPWGDDTLTYSYDAEGRRSKLQINGATTATTSATTYVYDALDRLTSLTGAGGQFTYSYQGASAMLSQLARPNGAKTTYAYDGLKRLTQIQNLTSTSVNISKYAYSYNTRDVRTSLQQQVGSAATQTINYGYDAIDQLVSEASTESTPLLNNQFSYDPMGNRTQSKGVGIQTSYVPNALNQYTSFSSISGSTTTPTSLSYDQSGNLKTTSSGTSKNTYTYDESDRLIRFATAVGAAKKTQTEFVYDGLSRKRLRREYTWDTTANAWKLVSETRSLYDGMNVIQERNGANLILTTYTRGLEMGGGIGGLLARTDSTGSYFYHYDGGGNVRQLTNSAQATVASYNYDAFGNTLSATGAQATQPYRFSTKEYIASCGLYDYGFRFYSTGMGRWINRDPLGEAGGLNVYAFTRNTPTNQIDPDGQLPILLLVPILWGAFEVGSAVYDGYNTAQTLMNPCASGAEKGVAVGGLALGLIAPGGGYSTAGTTAMRLGKQGEDFIEITRGLTKNTKGSDVGGKIRIPDFFQSPNHIVESKNVVYLAYTKQLKDYARMVDDDGIVEVVVRKNTRISKQLQKAFDDPRNPLTKTEFPW